MTQAINKQFFPDYGRAETSRFGKVTCFTCHQGSRSRRSRSLTRQGCDRITNFVRGNAASAGSVGAWGRAFAPPCERGSEAAVDYYEVLQISPSAER